MAQDLQTTDRSLAILGSWASSKPKLAKLVQDFQPGIDQRLPTPAERAELASLVPAFEAALVPASKAEIRRMIAKLAVGFPNAAKGTPDEVEARLELFAMALADVPADILGRACLEALKTCTFFPTPAELRKLCGEMAVRAWQLSRIRHLIAKHDAEWREPEESTPLSAEDQARVDAWLSRNGITIGSKAA